MCNTAGHPRHHHHHHRSLFALKILLAAVLPDDDGDNDDDDDGDGALRWALGSRMEIEGESLRWKQPFLAT